jgi:hypothetical protein
MKLKYILDDLRWLKVLNSPFKPFKVKLYAGKTQVGIPYFLPRKWVKGTPKLINEAILRHIEREERFNKSNPKYAREIKSFEELYEEYKNYSFPVPLKVGFSYCGLGYKTKWTSTDFRHEWNPVLSFVFFGYQIALTVYSPYHSHYWEPWLYYEYATDKTKSKRERIEQCRKEAPETWTSSRHNEEPVTTDYYTKILKSKWLKD